MAPYTPAVSALRAISFRISSATKSELPHVVAYLSQSLVSCKDLLSNQEAISQKDADAAVVINRFNTQITTLLQDRTAEGRWAAIVLVKAAIESGSWETLRKSNPWVRSLLTNLKKPDAPMTRVLCIIVLTRIFMLTWSYPTLIREITTPALPTFVSTCLSNLSSRGNPQDELRATLECFAQLIPHHPTIFRTHQDTIGKLLQSVLDAPHTTIPIDIRDLASRVAVLLHHCEPKGGAGEKWEKSLVATVRAAHVDADKTFVAVDEDWQSVAGNNVNKHVLTNLYRQCQESKAASERPLQQFVIAGSASLSNHLHLLATYFILATPSNVTVSLGAVADLLTRLFAVTISQSASRSSVKFSKDSTREEREGLTQVLPELHLKALELLSTVIDRYGSQLTPTFQSFIDQLVWIFNAESSDSMVKTAVYTVVQQTLQLAGPSLNKQTAASLRKIITHCCEGLVPSKPEPQPETVKTGNGVKAPQATMNADSFLKQPKGATDPTTQFSGLQKAAWDLLPVLLAKLPARNIPVALRSLMDRVAAIRRHKDAMIASTLNPPSTEAGKGANSLLPLLAREYASDPQVEALLRPRMPIIETGRRATTGADVVDEEDEEENEDEDVDMSEAEVDEAETEANAADESISAVPDVASTSASAAESAKAITSAVESYKAAPAQVPSQEPASKTTKTSASTAGKKRSRSPNSAKTAPEGKGTGEKRRRSARVAQSLAGADELPVVDAAVPKSVVTKETVVTVPAAAAAAASAQEDESDGEGDFEIPALVMGADSEDEDDE